MHSLYRRHMSLFAASGGRKKYRLRLSKRHTTEERQMTDKQTKLTAKLGPQALGVWGLNEATGWSCGGALSFKQQRDSRRKNAACHPPKHTARSCAAALSSRLGVV